MLAEVEPDLAQVADRLAVAVYLKEAVHGLGDLGPDAGNLAELFLARLLETIHVPEARGQELGGALAHHPDAEPVQHA